jgi:MFS family permease
MIKQIKEQYYSYPLTFRVLVLGTFIDRIGGALIFPFLSLYVAQRFNVGMTEIGILFGIWSISSLIGSMIGGALADKFGRRIILICGLIFSATSELLMGFVNNMQAFYVLAAFAGIFSDIGGPAQQAMVADLLQGEQRVKGLV